MATRSVSNSRRSSWSAWRAQGEADKLRDAGLKDCYKIKLTSAGYRLVYRVDDPAVTVTVVTVGKRNRGIAYEAAKRRRRP